MDQVKMETCSRCHARWFSMDLKNGICHACFLRDQGGKTPFLMSAENGMDTGERPPHLPALTQIEEMRTNDGLSLLGPPAPLLGTLFSTKRRAKIGSLPWPSRHFIRRSRPISTPPKGQRRGPFLRVEGVQSQRSQSGGANGSPPSGRRPPPSDCAPRSSSDRDTPVSEE
ncbi:uncharacterized protein Z518_03434 [Rhinocladiella mackenziei CBS 650.93]|uniref:Uncharacterized protein n=1 Tax=Rhinocladiella mackenziei CBS 650.93 TaxID=1442369 RepID=A0A0D2G2K1_9EURO|nr:uncharacterized protein Z518_03434 [Rhinocladiella mackenziei CBS 650.93]KIX08777.1 hypothetical protein Z518_03434 [Rhinocladiella mackenziei CBS 650.93]